MKEALLRGHFETAFGHMMRSAVPEYATDSHFTMLYQPGDWDGVVTDYIVHYLSIWYNSSIRLFIMDMNPSNLLHAVVFLRVAKHYNMDYTRFNYLGAATNYEIPRSTLYTDDVKEEFTDALILERLCYRRNEGLDISLFCELILRISPYLCDDIVAIRLGADIQPYFNSMVALSKSDSALV